MAYLRDTVYILKNEPFREHDAWITMYGREYGKLVAIARGARKWGAKQLGHLEPLAKVDVMLAKGEMLDKLAVAQAHEHLFHLHTRLETLTIGAAACDLMSQMTFPLVKDEAIFFLIEELLEMLNRAWENISSERAKLLLSAFSLKLLAELGYDPHLESCVHCRRELTERNWLIPSLGGIVCETCEHQFFRDRAEALPISIHGLKLLRFMTQRPLVEVMQIGARQSVFIEGSLLTEALVHMAPLHVHPHGFQTISMLLN